MKRFLMIAMSLMTIAHSANAQTVSVYFRASEGAANEMNSNQKQKTAANSVSPLSLDIVNTRGYLYTYVLKYNGKPLRHLGKGEYTKAELIKISNDQPGRRSGNSWLRAGATVTGGIVGGLGSFYYATAVRKDAIILVPFITALTAWAGYAFANAYVIPSSASNFVQGITSQDTLESDKNTIVVMITDRIDPIAALESTLNKY